MYKFTRNTSDELCEDVKKESKKERIKQEKRLLLIWRNLCMYELYKSWWKEKTIIGWIHDNNRLFN